MDDKNLIQLLKGLVIDGVHKAQSGHPGGAMSSMDFAYILFTEYMQFDPKDPGWMGRDRFVLSAGHESMLLYSLLYAVGWLKKSDLEKFRQLHSKTPGHPENYMTPGVECTTGPLGQGAAMAVGMAIAAKHLHAVFPGELFNQRIWVLLGDGCMQEDVTLGAASLAGHLKLDNLIWYYDKNRRQISGAIDRVTSDQEELIFQGFGWNATTIDGHDHNAIRKSLEEVTNHPGGKPTLIIGETVMAKGSATMEGSHKTHGSPLPKEEREKTKQLLGIPSGQEFYWTEEATQYFQRRFPALQKNVEAWKERLASQQNDAGFAERFSQYFSSSREFNLPEHVWNPAKNISTRTAFGDLLLSWQEHIPNLLGGSADLEGSNCTHLFAQKVQDFSCKNYGGRNLAFGVREFPMSAITNGMALFGGIIPFDATFLAFADYSRPALRLGAIQGLQVIHEFSHDSFYLGEDGPTHQPVEQIASLRAMPNMYVMRPADAKETEVMFAQALRLNAPSVLCLTRQDLPVLSHSTKELQQARKGAWFVKEAKNPVLILFATGSEVSLAFKVAKRLEQKDPVKFKEIAIVSVPCWELFFHQDAYYKNSILSLQCQNRVSIEAGTSFGWERFVGRNGLMISLDHFGASGPAEELANEFGFTEESIEARILLTFFS